MVTEEDYLEIKDAVKRVNNSLFMPDQKALLVLYKFYKRMNPSNGICFTCSGDRARILKYSIKFLETWQTNQ